MSAKIFVNYRQEDDPGSAGRVFDWIEREFNPGEVFMDVDGIEPGLNFVRVLEARVSDCDVLLAIMGPHWLNCKDENGNRRIDDVDDFVRIEIVSAIRQRKRVIPVIVGRGIPPKKHQLPDDLKALAELQATWVTHRKFRSDIQSLIPYIRGVLGEADKSRLKDAEAPPLRPVTAGAASYKRAYLCYASKDRREVLKRAQALRLAGIEFFSDLLSLEPGDRWEHKLYEQIRRSDLFLLFWSKAAADSKWVLREVKVALEAQSSSPDLLPDIVPVILETPSPAPPEWLRHIHFGDRYDFLAATERR
jgi:hypothetical protein